MSFTGFHFLIMWKHQRRQWAAFRCVRGKGNMSISTEDHKQTVAGKGRLWGHVAPDSSFSHLYVILRFKLGWVWLLASNELNTAEVMGCQFKDQVLKKLWLPLWDLSLRICTLGGTSWHDMRSPTEKVTWQGADISRLHLAKTWDQWTAPWGHFKVDFLPVESRDNCSSRKHLDCRLLGD